MKLLLSQTNWRDIEASAVAIFITSDEANPQGLGEFDVFFHGKLSEYIKEDGYTADYSKSYVYRTEGKIKAPKLILIGLGKESEMTAQKLRLAAARLSRIVKILKLSSVAVAIRDDNDVAAQTQLIVEGSMLGNYEYTKYKSAEKNKTSHELTILSLESKHEVVKAGFETGREFAQATIFARDLINESPTVTTPTFLASEAKKLAKKGAVSVDVLDKKEIEKLGMHSYLAVNRGSDESPKFIKLIYHGDPKHKVVVAGKGITFDTGGLSLKDAKGMETMKMDMAGAAAVLGVFSVLPILKPKVTVVGLIAATENMPGAKAIKPGDIVTAMNGKTIEILNTDAEGRLTLADVLSYAVAKEKPEAIVDLATLTGACCVALGDDIAGLFSNDKKLKEQISTAASDAGELVWELPLEENYKALIKSDIADLRNTGKTRYGGAITAALFLEEFVDKTPWVHLDIAGPAFAEKNTSLTPHGGVGFGVRTILNWLQSF